MKFVHVLAVICLYICGFGVADEEFYALKATDIQGNVQTMEKYRGKVLLIVNVASECGFTKKQYKGLVKLWGILGHRNKFTILAFPCNQFGNQEPASDVQIEYFIRTHFKVEFPMFSKINVAGSDAHPIFKYLSAKTNQTPDWNFWKYLVDHKGNAINAWDSNTAISEIFDDIKSYVDKAEAADNESTEENKTEL